MNDSYIDMTKDRELYIKQIKEIREQKMWSWSDVAREIGISRPAMIRFVDNTTPCLLRTMRLVRAFIEKYQQKVI